MIKLNILININLVKQKRKRIKDHRKKSQSALLYVFEKYMIKLMKSILINIIFGWIYLS